MFSIFFKITGMTHIDCIENGSTITSDNCVKNCLKPLIKVNRQRPISRTTNMKILDDSTRPQNTKIIKSNLNQVGITIIRHLSYSSDLAPFDFWLFDLIKKSTTDSKNQKRQKLSRFFEQFQKKNI